MIAVWLAALAASATSTPVAPSNRNLGAWAEQEVAENPFEGSREQVVSDVPLKTWNDWLGGKIVVKPMEYRSDGLNVTGFVVRPAQSGQKRPILIWARGGIGDVRQSGVQLALMADWVRRGYIVVASNYRGSAGSEGKDEFAGADVDDLVNLLPAIGAIAGADPDRLYGIGYSRGAVMLLQAAAGRIPFKAIATAGAISDLELMAGEVPDLDREFQKMMPDYAADKAQHFCRRSAICWADKITAPVLLAHGGADGVVSAAHDQRLSAKLELLHKPYRALVLGGADHGLSGARQVFFDAAQQFFEHPPAKP